VPDVLLLCEHPHVITLGRNGKLANLRASDHVLDQMEVSFFESDRGGDITYHGPGQIVGYPIVNLAEIQRDVAWYMRSLEEAMIRATLSLASDAARAGRTGVWVDAPAESGGEEKLAAIGVHLSRWLLARVCLQRVDGFALFRFNCAMRDCRQAGHFSRTIAGAQRENGRSLASHRGAPRRVARLELRPMRPGDLDTMLRTHEDRDARMAVQAV